MTAERAERRTTDTPAIAPTARGIDLSALALRYATLLRVAYLVCIGIATLLRLGFDPSLPAAVHRLQRAFVPSLNFRDVIDAARNVALFLGWGATWVLTARAPARWKDVLAATLLGMAASVTVEAAQVFSQVRMASIVDVVTNTLGALLGAAALWAAERRATLDLRRGTTIGIPAWVPTLALLTLAGGLTFAPPWRPTSVVSWDGSPFERARVVAATPPHELSPVSLLPDGLAWLVLGLAIGIAVRDRDGRFRPRQMLLWLVLAGGVLAGTHTGRAMAGLQEDAGALAVQAAALLAGVISSLAGVPRWRAAITARSSRAAQLGVLVAVLGAVMAWSPASWAIPATGSPAASWRQLVPMLSLFERQDLSSVFLVLQKAGFGAALGACLAARTRMGVSSLGVRAAIGYAMLLEVGQLLVPGRYPDITDVLITAAAAGLMAVLVERAGQGVRHDPTAADAPRA